MTPAIIKKTPKSLSQQLGFRAEEIAKNYLTQRGLKFIARNYHCRMGEIDLIMQDKNFIVFIEVRLRRNNQFGNASDTVNRIKQAKLIKTAYAYLQKEQLLNKTPCRFDVIAISEITAKPAIDWIKNAFANSIGLF